MISLNKIKQTLLLIFLSFSLIYMTFPTYSFGQCNKKMIYKIEKFAKSEGNEYLKDFVIYPKSVVNEKKKTYRLQLEKGIKYVFYMSAKQSEFHAKMTLLDSELNLIDTMNNREKQKYYAIQFKCEKSDIYIFEVSGLRSNVSSKNNCITVVLTSQGKEE